MLQNTGEDNVAAGLDEAGEFFRQRQQRLGKNVGQQQLDGQIRQVARNDGLDARGDLILFRIVARGDERLRIVVHRPDVARAQLQRGDGENAGTTTVVDYFGMVSAVFIQPLQAQRGGGVGAGAEGEARV